MGGGDRLMMCCKKWNLRLLWLIQVQFPEVFLCLCLKEYAKLFFVHSGKLFQTK